MLIDIPLDPLYLPVLFVIIGGAGPAHNRMFITEGRKLSSDETSFIISLYDPWKAIPGNSVFLECLLIFSAGLASQFD